MSSSSSGGGDAKRENEDITTQPAKRMKQEAQHTAANQVNVCIVMIIIILYLLVCLWLNLQNDNELSVIEWVIAHGFLPKVLSHCAPAELLCSLARVNRTFYHYIYNTSNKHSSVVWSRVRSLKLQYHQDPHNYHNHILCIDNDELRFAHEHKNRMLSITRLLLHRAKGLHSIDIDLSFYLSVFAEQAPDGVMVRTTLLMLSVVLFE